MGVPANGRKSTQGHDIYRKAIERASATLGMTASHVEVRAPADIEPAFEALVAQRAQAVIVYGGPITYVNMQQIIDLAAKHRLPDMQVFRLATESGALASYGPDLYDLSTRSVEYVDKILRGAKPGELPVEQPRKYEMLVNIKRARALGLTISASVRARVDEFIE